LVHGDDLEPASASAFDDHGQGPHGLAAIASTIMQKDDVAAALIVRCTGRQVIHYVAANLLGAATGVIFPVAGVYLVPHGHVTHVLREL
jgi:hypothetical protein